MRIIAWIFCLGTTLCINFCRSVVDAGERIVLVAGGSREDVNIPAKEAKLYEPFAAEFDDAGNLWIVEMASANRLLKLDGSGNLQHVAGQKHKSTTGQKPTLTGREEPGLEASFHGPHNIAIPNALTVLVGDTWNGRVRQYNTQTGSVRDLPGYATEPEKARSSGPYCISLNPKKTKLYIADLNVVRCLELDSGNLSIVAGNGKKGVPTDGAMAIESPLVDPRAVAIDRHDNLYILERGGNALRKVSPDGRINTVINRSGKKGISPQQLPGLEATMNGPKHLCIDRDDSVIVADAENHVVLRYTPRDQRVTRIAGTGKQGSEGLGGDPTDCNLSRPHGVSVHPTTGELYITDSYNDRVLKVVRD
jgi:DNA-binding beta-propeller fold protein YncE